MAIRKISQTPPTMASIVSATNNSQNDSFSCNYIKTNSNVNVYNKNESFAFSGNNYAEKIITLPKNISDYNVLIISVGDNQSGWYMDQFVIPAEFLTSGYIYRKRILMATVQNYMSIQYNDTNKIKIHLEHTATISGSKDIKVLINNINNY